MGALDKPVPGWNHEEDDAPEKDVSESVVSVSEVEVVEGLGDR